MVGRRGCRGGVGLWIKMKNILKIDLDDLFSDCVPASLRFQKRPCKVVRVDWL